MRRSHVMAVVLAVLLAAASAAAVTLGQGPITVTTSDALTSGPGDPIFNRPTGGSDGGTCSLSGVFPRYILSLLAISNGGVNPVMVTLDLTMEGAEGGEGTLPDPFIASYSAFDPLLACQDLILADDNGAPNGVDATVQEVIVIPAMSSVVRFVALTSARQAETGSFKYIISATPEGFDPIVLTFIGALVAPGVGVPLLSGLAGAATLAGLFALGMRGLRRA
ncbi:MAG: hypothetical protein ACRERC_01365 [Candidatus Binatia bacterium]